MRITITKKTSNKGNEMSEEKTVTLAKDSLWAKFDTDGDGTLTDAEIATGKEMLELELQEEKAQAQKMMAWVAIVTSFLCMLVLFTPFVSDARVLSLGAIVSAYAIAQVGVVGAYIAGTAYTAKKK